MAILHIFNRTPRNSEPLADSIEKIKNGDSQLREIFINEYKPFIIKTISKTTGKYIAVKNSEEFSIGLIAFNEAINYYDADKNAGFLNFAQTVIKRRLIDYMRKNQKHNKVYPLSYFDNDENENKSSFENKYLIVDSSSQFGNIETKEEIALFIKKLNDFGIELQDLIKNSPKHLDSKRLSISIARVLVQNKELSEKLERKKNIPMVDLMKLIDVNHKTVERNRKFIISVYLIITSNLEVMKGYVENIEKGGKDDE